MSCGTKSMYESGEETWAINMIKFNNQTIVDLKFYDFLNACKLKNTINSLHFLI